MIENMREMRAARFLVACVVIGYVTAAGDDVPTEDYDSEEPNWHKNARAPGNEPPPGQQSLGSFKTPQVTSEERDSVVLPQHMHCDGDDTRQLTCSAARNHSELIGSMIPFLEPLVVVADSSAL